MLSFLVAIQLLLLVKLCTFYHRKLPASGKVCIQMEDEISGILLQLLGAAMCGKRAMTASLGPWYFSKIWNFRMLDIFQKFLLVVVNVMRGGP